MRAGRRAGHWRALSVVLGVAAILAADLPGPLLAMALVALWCLARLRGPSVRSLWLSAEEVTLVQSDGRRLRLARPLRGWMLPDSITLSTGRWGRIQVFRDQCDEADFRALRRLLSGAGR